MGLCSSDCPLNSPPLISFSCIYSRHVCTFPVFMRPTFLRIREQLLRYRQCCCLIHSIKIYSTMDPALDQFLGEQLMESDFGLFAYLGATELLEIQASRLCSFYFVQAQDALQHAVLLFGSVSCGCAHPSPRLRKRLSRATRLWRETTACHRRAASLLLASRRHAPTETSVSAVNQFVLLGEAHSLPAAIRDSLSPRLHP